MPTKIRALTASLFVLAALAGCRSPSASLRGLAQDQHDDVIVAPRSVEELHAQEQRTLERADRAKELLGQKGVDSAADHFNAALVFVQCTRELELELAHQQALVAAERGEKRGLRVAAEAFDKLLLKRGMAQRYGTQFEWVPVLRSWRLYALDPRTTDAERQAMGVPPLAELQKQAAELNHKQQSAPAAPK